MRRRFVLSRDLLVLVGLSLGLGLGACKAEKAGEDAATAGAQAPAQAQVEPSQAEPSQAEPSQAEARAQPGGPVELGGLFAGSEPAVPAAIAQLHAGLSRGEVQTRLPKLRSTEQGRLAALDDPAGFAYQLRFDAADSDAWLISTTVELERNAAVAAAKAAWGEPKTATDGHGNTSFFWFDPEARLRASLTPTRAETVKLEIMPYETPAGLLGQLGFGAGELLGLSRAELEARHGDRLRRIVEPEPPRWTAQLWYPASTWNPQPSLVQLDSDDSGEGVARVVVELPFLHLPALRDELFAGLVERFGEPERGDAESGARFETEAVAIDARLERGRWILTATPATKQ